MSTLAVNNLTTQTGSTITLASGKTLDLSNGTVTGLPPAKLLKVTYGPRTGPGLAITSTSFTEISTNMRVTHTIISASSYLDFTVPLYTEVDGSTGHGLARLQYSTDSGSNWSNIGTYNITSAIDNSIGFGFTDYWDHNQSVGTAILFRVQYRITSGAQNAIADNGPGESPRTYIKVAEYDIT